MNNKLFSLSVLVVATACAPLLEADFDGFAPGSFSDQTFDLPGAPTGDELLYLNAGFITQDGPGDRSLSIFRDVLNNDPVAHGEAYFDPIDAADGQPLFFSWSGTLNPNQASSSDPAVVAIKLKDKVNDNQVNLFSKLNIRFGEQKITAQVSGGNEVSIGNSVTGPHGVILRVDPNTLEYRFAITGEGVSPGGGFTHIGTLSSGTTIDPQNIGISITFADEIDAAGSFYTIDDVKISQIEP